MPRYRIRTRVARLMLGLLLFVQAALALADCDSLRAAPALAIAASSSQMPCHEEPAVNANLCLAHCLSADQSPDTPQVAVPAWTQAVPLVVVDVAGAPSRSAILYYALPRPAAPPPRILFQSFLI